MAEITVGDIAYDLPALDTISIGESKIIKRHSGMTLDQLFELEGLDGGAIGGLLAVAMKRHDPNLSDRELDRLVNEVNLFAVMEELAAEVEPNPTTPAAGRRERKQQRANRIFWFQWERRFGALPGEVDPRLYWVTRVGRPLRTPTRRHRLL